ncbi:uncharacterized protein EDB91DRAFT_1257844 [Suillus paluster]|uniref:uncharacterized protein n=1 Tax=Suillus paluster TaxID=48578 RepID=UPI001B86438B|nr:uncharacterized protein EDB91DRAFT_1257844 [Suillus paluster]KAG1719199.1 hypothetical protein EDB91DRAFT_1257844 [Suillus paluster]
MSTITQLDSNPHCSSFPRKIPIPYKPYETRSPTSPQATPVPVLTRFGHKSSPLTSIPPGSPLNKTAKVLSSQTSMPVKEELQENKPAKGVPAIADPFKLYHDILQSFHYEYLTSNTRKVLKYITTITLEKSQEFHGVRAQEFILLEQAADRVLTRPRLNYNYTTRILSVDMPSILHESAFDYLSQSFTLAITKLSYDPFVIRPLVHMNYPLALIDQTVQPDMTISISATEKIIEKVLIPFVGECAFSQERDSIFKKVQDEIAAHPEIIIVVIVLVREAKLYACPADDSTASKILCNGADDPSPLPIGLFTKQHSTPRVFNEPVIIPIIRGVISSRWSILYGSREMMGL